MESAMTLTSKDTAQSREGPTETPYAGQLIGERYLLEQPLERGAMGSVWRAEHVRLRAPVAVKFLDASLIVDTEMRDRFTQEARSAAAVRSAHVVQVLDYGTEGGVPYIAMELLEGENLDARLGRKGRLAPEELSKIFVEVARGLGKAHTMGVVHRDLKPGNIFIAREGDHEITKLVDFGIAKVKADALNLSQIVGTQLGTLLGTPQYMSPEQMRGSPSVDYHTDLWALAIIACECLTGRYPFSGTTIGDLTVQICTEKPLAPSSLGPVPPGFDQWFFKATRKTPSKRFESAEQMARALAKLLAGAESSAPAALGVKRASLPNRTAIGRAYAAAVTRMDASFTLLRTWVLRAWDRAELALSSLRLRLAMLSERLPGGVALPRIRPALFAVVGLVVLALSIVLKMPNDAPEANVAAAGTQAAEVGQLLGITPTAAAAPEQVVLAATPKPAPPPAEAEAVSPPAEAVAQDVPRVETATPGVSETKTRPRARAVRARVQTEKQPDPIARAAARILEVPEKAAKPAAPAQDTDTSQRRAAAAERHPFDDRL